MTVRGPRDIAVRERRRMPRPQVDTGRAAYSMLLGLGAVLLIGAISFYQLSAPAVAQQLMAEGIAALTEIDAVLEEHAGELDTLVAESEPDELIEIPGFPLDVRFTKEEYEELSDEEFRNLLLARGASLVYTDGLSAFDDGSGGSIPAFSLEGTLGWLVGLLSETNHDRAGIAAAILGVLTSIAAVMVVVRSTGFNRVRALGVPLILAAVAGLVATFLMSLVIGSWWGGDPFSDEVNAIISDGLQVGQRNFTVLLVLGIALLVVGIVFELLGRFAFREPEDISEY